MQQDIKNRDLPSGPVGKIPIPNGGGQGSIPD